MTERNLDAHYTSRVVRLRGTKRITRGKKKRAPFVFARFISRTYFLRLPFTCREIASERSERSNLSLTYRKLVSGSPAPTSTAYSARLLVHAFPSPRSRLAQHYFATRVGNYLFEKSELVVKNHRYCRFNLAQFLHRVHQVSFILSYLHFQYAYVFLDVNFTES